MAVVANTYANYLLDSHMRAAEFSQIQQLVSKIPIRRVTPHAEASRLAGLCDTIVHDSADSLNRVISEAPDSSRS